MHQMLRFQAQLHVQLVTLQYVLVFKLSLVRQY